MIQMENYIEELERLCIGVWTEKEVEMQQLGAYVSKIYPYIAELISRIDGDKELLAQILARMNDLTEGLQHNDKYYVADVLYDEVREILMIGESNE